MILHKRRYINSLLLYEKILNFRCKFLSVAEGDGTLRERTDGDEEDDDDEDVVKETGDEREASDEEPVGDSHSGEETQSTDARHAAGETGGAEEGAGGRNSQSFLTFDWLTSTSGASRGGRGRSARGGHEKGGNYFEIIFKLSKGL